MIKRAILIAICMIISISCSSLVFCMTVDELADAPVTNLDPNGELKNVFRLMSDYTDLQREDMLDSIKGKVVVWTLRVYEVSRLKPNLYNIILNGEGGLGVDAYVTSQNDEEKKLIHSLKTGSIISIKGMLTGKMNLARALKMAPAILWNDSHPQNKPVSYGSLSVESCTDSGALLKISGYSDLDDIIYYAPKSSNLCDKISRGKQYAVAYQEGTNSNGAYINIIKDIRPLLLIKEPKQSGTFRFIDENRETEAPFLLAKSITDNKEYTFSLESVATSDELDKILSDLKKGQKVTITYQPIYVNAFDEPYEYLRLESINRLEDKSKQSDKKQRKGKESEQELKDKLKLLQKLMEQTQDFS